MDKEYCCSNCGCGHEGGACDCPCHGQERDCECGCGCCGEEEESESGRLEELADGAWEHLMRKKMEALLEKAEGKRMDAVAKVVVEHTRKFWKMKMENRKMEGKEYEEYEKKLMDAFGK
ncbi:Uncharacterised protein [uncultured archaeon]|nr:Uncharacterised protein [uncultured archaeon]